jgi:hypothetical protein
MTKKGFLDATNGIAAVRWPASDTRGEAKQIEPQMNANGSVPNRPSERIVGFALAEWCVPRER